jgi:hypothetical protein
MKYKNLFKVLILVVICITHVEVSDYFDVHWIFMYVGMITGLFLFISYGLIDEIDKSKKVKDIEYPKEILDGNKFMKILIKCGVSMDDIKNREWFITELEPHKYHCIGYHPVAMRIDIIKDKIVV